MLRKFFILVLLFATSTVWAATCDTTQTTLFNLDIPDSIMGCRRDTLRFEAQTTFKYEWSTQSQNPFFVITSAQKIWVKISDTVNFCERQDTIAIHLFPVPIPNRHYIDTTLCFGQTFVLNSGGAAHTDTFFWLNPEVAPGDTLYYVRDSIFTVVFDSNKHSIAFYPYIAMLIGHCINGWENATEYTIFDTAFIFFAHRPIVDFGIDTALCDSDEGFILTALSEADFLTSEYNFRWQNNSTLNTFRVNYDNQGLQFVHVWNQTCKDTVSDSIRIKFWPKEWTDAFKLTLDTAVCEKIQVRLDATAKIPNRTTYHWSGEDIDTTDIHNPIRIVLQGGFSVVLRDSALCERKFTIKVGPDNCAPKLDMPNIFTPNGDGINDFFKPIVVDKIKNFRMRIYNRWGRVVYEFSVNEAPSPAYNSWRGWDGTNGGTPVPEGTYFWVVKFDDLFDRNHAERGTVTLLR